MGYRIAALMVVFFACCGIAFNTVAGKDGWWTAKFTILASTNSSVSVGSQAKAVFYLDQVKFSNDIASSATTEVTKDYSDINGFDDGTLNDMEIIRLTIEVGAAVVALYGLLAVCLPKFLSKVRFLFAFIALGCFGLAITNLILTADIPNAAVNALNTNFPNLTSFICSSSTFTFNGYTFQGESIQCGTIWKTLEYSLYGSSGTTASLEYTTYAGNSFWWTFGTMFAMLFSALACRGVKYEIDPRGENKPLPNHSDVSDANIEQEVA
eukprot:TRINITY_DN1033_c0_g1_i1.p1 TRINITY_DN1033_c0_g1~~TRINITY_DN1033_c0_g1_i1.p1  ORF type:complete len:287 (+),score=77.90 TRINITY_DN1033_c0_g1_i1:62-862(+)